MNACDVIGWTFDGAAYCLDHKPAEIPGRDPVSPVFGSDAHEWEDGGLTCEAVTVENGRRVDCGAVIVESDTCRACDRSLSRDHDEYTFGTTSGTERRLVNVQKCRPHNAAVIRVRERCGSAWSIAVGAQLVPFDADPDDALAAICAAYAGTVATFDVIETEAVPV